MINYANEIKIRTNIVDIIEFYGFDIGRAHKICCPFHNEVEPSLHIYRGSNTWHCFGCGEGGDVIDFVGKYFGISFSDAIRKINDDFALMLPIGKKPTLGAMLRTQRITNERELKQKKIAEAEKEYNKILKEYTKVNNLVLKIRSLEDITDEEAWALQSINIIEYRLDCAQEELNELLQHNR